MRREERREEADLRPVGTGETSAFSRGRRIESLSAPVGPRHLVGGADIGPAGTGGASAFKQGELGPKV
jgi:hypothetical protein